MLRITHYKIHIEISLIINEKLLVEQYIHIERILGATTDLHIVRGLDKDVKTNAESILKVL